jgi:hypothetical protein
MKPDITESLVLHVDAAPPEVLAAVDRMGGDPFAGVRELGGGPRERRFALTWSPAYGTSVDVTWDLRVEPDEDDGSYLCSTRRFHAADDASRDALDAGWGNVRAVADAVARRTLRTVKRAAEASRVEPRRPVELRPAREALGMLLDPARDLVAAGNPGLAA